MKILRYGDRGSLVSLLQKGLKRAGFELEVDGVFGEETRRQLTRFQRREGLTEDGVAGPATEQALGPWYRGYTEHVIRPGDTLWSIAGRYGSRLALLESANPGIDPFRLMAGQRIVVPFAFPVVPGDVPVSGELVGYCVLTFAEVKIADGSQFRRFLADGRYGADTQYKTTEMAQTVNAVLAHPVRGRPGPGRPGGGPPGPG